MKRSTAINSFYGIEFKMRHATSRGRYVIEARYRGKDICAETTDSEAYDWYDDDSNKVKHRDALRHCYHCIQRAYELDKEYSKFLQ
jgi:hypothetical protein